MSPEPRSLRRSSARSLRFSAPERGGASGAGIAEARGALGRPDRSPHSCASPTAWGERGGGGGGLGPGARLRAAEPSGVGNRAPGAGSPGNVAASEGVPRSRRLLRAERKRWAGGGAWLPAPLCSLGAGRRVSSAQSWVPRYPARGVGSGGRVQWEQGGSWQWRRVTPSVCGPVVFCWVSSWCLGLGSFKSKMALHNCRKAGRGDQLSPSQRDTPSSRR